jgi:MraZ protein
MLLGEFEHTIDDKNRLTLPAKFRQALSGGLIITRGMEGCLSCYPAADWQRHFFAGASEAEPDKQGRVLVPTTLAKEAGIERDVVVAGVGDRLEIWDRDAWRAHVKEFEGSAEDVAERLATQRN